MSEVEVAGIAVVGLAGRFPKAGGSLDEFWRNLCEGVEAVSFFSDDELEAGLRDDPLLAHPNYVRAAAVLDDIESFDASFFGMGAREAEVTDPQHRLFLECAWEALESAGYDPAAYGGLIGVYGGVGRNDYMLNLYTNPHIMRAVAPVQLTIGNCSDYVTTRVSYKLNLRGPSVNVQTACSTSLVAVHLACQSLLNGECDIALAGGVSLNVPQKAGYLYEEGGIDSPDGHCRAYDARARGTVSGNGGGVVALKRLADAVADGDFIHAVILGSAINNDGSLKVGFTAPSIEGQAEVISEALNVAGVSAESISYVEGHGTGTALGDPIEIAALTQAYRADTQERNFCAIGSVKSGIGHLDTGAGVAGIIKTVLALKHGLLPPSLNFDAPNPEIDFENSPFYVNHTLKPWETGDEPRRAGVSSFGIGGTNAHAVLEEAPAVEATGDVRPRQLLLLSAKTESALEAATDNLTAHLKAHPEVELADVAYTLQVGRGGFSHRRALVCRDTADALSALEARDPKRVLTLSREAGERSVAFIFSGQGTQYVNMGRGLYETERVFREQLDRCAALLEPHLGFDLRDALYPDASNAEEAARRLAQTEVTQPALFAVEYALARQWMKWGVRPAAMIGHSLGEYVAACLAGVFTLEDALMLVAARGRLMQQLPSGAMLSVGLSESEVEPYLGEGLSLAAVNAPSLCVVSGDAAEVERLRELLTERGVAARPLVTSHAFHSRMMEPVLAPFEELLGRVGLKPPKVPFISNVTGTWIQDREATDPAYWSRHLRQTVRFAEGLGLLTKDPQWVLLEVGPGNALTTFARQLRPAGETVLPSLRHPREEESDVAFLLGAAGRLWLAGVGVDWPKFNEGLRRRRVPLPTYPFERRRYWVERRQLSLAATAQPPQANTDLPTQDAAPVVETVGQAASGSLHPRPRMTTAYVEPGGDLEPIVAELWQEKLGVAPVGANDNFFELGGDSLLATQVVSRLRDVLRIDLQLRHFFERPTVAELAEGIEAILVQEISELSEEDAQSLLQ